MMIISDVTSPGDEPIQRVLLRFHTLGSVQGGPPISGGPPSKIDLESQASESVCRPALRWQDPERQGATVTACV
jgi:hypothetical protein